MKDHSNLFKKEDVVTKADVMNFLDEYPGIYFKVSDIKKAMKKQYNDVNVQAIYCSLRGIVKRENYELSVVSNCTGHKVKLYRRV